MPRVVPGSSSTDSFEMPVMRPLLRKAAFRTFGTLMPDRASAWFERALLTPRPVSSLGLSEPSAPKTVSRTPYASGWVQVAEWGAGPAVLLLHGWGDRMDTMYGLVDPLVQAGHRVVAIDLPAHGGSDGRRTNLIDCAGAALQVGRAYGRLAGVVSHSFGGPVTAFAMRHGLRADRVAMVAPPLDIRALSIPVGDWLGLPRRVSEGMMDRFAARFQLTWEEIRVDRLVGRMEAPLLVLHDLEDRVVPWKHGEAVAGAALDGTFHITSGHGHRGMLADPDQLRRMVRFLTRDAARAA